METKQLPWWTPGTPQAVEDVEKLLKTKTGAMGCTDDRGFSGLMYAARDDFTKVVEVLIKAGGADANLVI